MPNMITKRGRTPWRETVLTLMENRFLRFLIAGGINTLFGFLVFSLAVFAGLPTWLALIVSTVAGTLFNFFTTGAYVFRDLTCRRLPRFVLCYAMVYVVNLEALGAVQPAIGSKIAAQAALALPIAFLAYWLLARFAFAPKAV